MAATQNLHSAVGLTMVATRNEPLALYIYIYETVLYMDINGTKNYVRTANTTTVRIFEDTSDKRNTLGICTGKNHAQTWIGETKLLDILIKLSSTSKRKSALYKLYY
jgi:hypothetical protein